jgi:hypothetical protein
MAGVVSKAEMGNKRRIADALCAILSSLQVYMKDFKVMPSRLTALRLQ